VSDFFQKHTRVNATIYAPYHAAHLHSPADIERIIRPQTREIFSAAKVLFPVCSSVSGEPIVTENPLELLKVCLGEILLEALHWDLVLKYCGSTTANDVKVYAVGPTNLSGSMVAALKACNAQVAIEDQSTWLSAPPAETKRKVDSDIAVIGMAGRFPDAADHELFWQLLEQARDVHRPVPADRYPVDSHTDPAGKKRNTSHTPYGNFIENPGLFDARFFNMSPREAAQTDPMQRLMLVTAYEAMEMGGMVIGRTPSTKRDRIGTFYGQTSDDWREINAAQDIDTYFISGGVRAFGPGRLNYFFKFSGPSFSVDTACSSSFAALNVACTSLRAGECDTAFSGGANVLTNPDIFAGLSRGHFLSKTGSCKTFDHGADGYCRGDGVATVILKRMDDAIADKDPILGVIKGFGTNHSADAVSITHPCAKDQSFLFSKVLAEAHVDPRDVNYVEMHGTGTQAGDGIEMESVTSVFAPRNRRRGPDQPLYLGAVKSNIGHGEAVSGVTALIKVLQMLRKSAIPPHTGIKTEINRSFPTDLAERNVNIARKLTPLLRPAGGKRTVFINNFSAAGGNTAVLLEDGPQAPAPAADPRSHHVVTVSAKSLAAFKKTIQKVLSYVDANPSIHLPNLSYTTTARRAHYTYRAAFSVGETAQLVSSLKTLQDGTHNPITMNAPQVAFAFTGQGSQYTAMGKTLYETSLQFRDDLEKFNKIAVGLELPSFLTLVDGSVDVKELPPTVVQLGMTCVQMALTRLWSAWGIRPSVVIGHSLGEYAALEAAGVLSVSDTIYLVGRRAALLEEKCTVGTHAMLAVRAPVAAVQDVVVASQGKIEIACINGISDTVLSGTVEDIDGVAETLSTSGQKSTKLRLPFAFHSSQVETILPAFEKISSAATFHPPRIPVISPLISDVVREVGTFNATYLGRHCRKTVDFVGGLTTAMSQQVISSGSVWLEVGAHPICASMIKSTLGVGTLPSLRRDEDPWKIISNSVVSLYAAGIPFDFNAYHSGFENLSVLDMPTYGFDEKVYWLQYEGDWTLTKNHAPAPAAQKAITEAPKPKSLTTSIQTILSEQVEAKKAKVVAESDLAEQQLFNVVSGHLVNGAGLCPSSLYADMALTITDYAYKLLKPGSKVDMNVGTMDCRTPLILKNVKNPENQVVQIETIVDLVFGKAEFKISSNGGKTLHARCTITFEDAATWTAQWQRTAFLIQDRMKMLKAKMEDGEADKVGRRMAYKLFQATVNYSEKFQGMNDVTFDGPEREATSHVKFRAGPQDGTFAQSPFFIDSVAHLSGFIANAAADSKNEVYISHGWESMRFAETLDHTKEYNAYVKMQPAGGKMVAGDVYIFNSERNVIGVVGGLKFQCIPRTLLNTFLPPADGPAPARARPQVKAPAPAAANKRPTAIEIPKTTKKTSKPAKAPKPAKAALSGMMSKTFDIIIAELNVEASELADAIQWADLGVDSLMALTISGRFREELDLEMSSTLFTDYASVGELRAHFASTMGGQAVPSSSSSTADESDYSDGEDTNGSGITTPDSEEFDVKELKASRAPAPAVASVDTQDGDLIATIRSTIAEEMDIDIEEITEATDLSTLGMDSLMSLQVLGSLREKSGIELDSTILTDNPSLGHLRKALGLDKPAAAPPLTSKSEIQQPAPVRPGTSDVTVVKKMPPATSVLLQGNVKTATRNLFLFPDGSGSATSYAGISKVDATNLAIFGLNCPFMKDPTSYTCGIEGVSKLYLEEVLRRQPTGPYLLGGWSAGGVIAYEVTRQLDDMNRANPAGKYYVEQLVLIDSPCPVALEPLPARLHHFFDEIGLLSTGTGKAPSWLLPHFEYSIKALTAYKPEARSSDGFASPPVLFIWATEGVCGKPGDPRPPPQADDPKSMKFLLDNRTDFGPNGWDKLLDVGGGKAKMRKIDGNHFTMMRPPVVSTPTPFHHSIHLVFSFLFFSLC
jgi:iterative type I PKS product template protein